MAKRISEAAKLCECESEDCATELPLKKRLKLLQADYDAKQNEAHGSDFTSPMIRLAEVACALAAAADAAEISDDDGDHHHHHHDDSSVTTTEDDHSTAGSTTDSPRRTTVQQKQLKSVGPTGLPTRLMPLRSPARFLPPSQRRPVTKYNFCPTGKPLTCPPKLFMSKVKLGDIDSTLA